MNFFQGSQQGRIDNLVAYQVEGGFHLAVNAAEQKTICDLLQPIEDASHTRDRKRSPPDSACMQGTRREVVQKVGAWSSSCILVDGEPHICWMHGYVGCGKSAISQEICRECELEGRPVASFFFYRNSGDRSRIWRFAPTVADQMAAGVPETAPFVRAAATASPGLKNFPVPVTSVAMQMQRLVYGPFKSAADRGPIGSLAGHPFLIVIDGLDECEDKEEVGDLIDGMLAFFDKNPSIPLQIFITSRVEQHIQSRLNVPGVHLDNLVNHCSDGDIAAFLDVLFQDARRRNLVIQAYVRERGEWPTSSEKRKLVEHISGSFIFAWAVFKFVMGSNPANEDLKTPMDRLPLALKMNPGLDGLYAQILARSEHLPHFLDIISTLALLRAPLPTSGIAELLGINTYKVVNVLVDLQAIIQVPGTDDMPVTLCHTSLRDFLTTQSRSGRYFAHPRHHVRLYLRFLKCEYELRRRRPGVNIHLSECTPAVTYYRRYSIDHLEGGRHLFEGSEPDSAIGLCRETLSLHPGSPELIHALADAIGFRAGPRTSRPDLEEAISLYREALLLRPSGDEGRWLSLQTLGDTLVYHYTVTRTMSDLEEAIDLCREALTLRPSPHPDRWESLHSLATALLFCHQHTGTMADRHLEEGISLQREALERRSSPHSVRSIPLMSLGDALLDRSKRTESLPDLEEAVSLHREALNLRQSPHPDRPISLNALGNALLDRYRRTGSMSDLEESISLCREALDLHPSPHTYRSISLNILGNALLDRYRFTKTVEDLEEAVSLHREALDSRLSPHPDRSISLNHLANALLDRYWFTKTVEDLEEAVSLYREGLGLQPSAHPDPDRSTLLNNFGIALVCRYRRTKSLADLEEAISLQRDALSLRPSPHPNCSTSLNNLGTALLDRYRGTKIIADLEEAISSYREAFSLRPPPHPGRPTSARGLSLSLWYMFKATRALPDLQEAITSYEELLEIHHPVGHNDRVETLDSLAYLLQKRFDVTGQQEDLDRIDTLKEEESQLLASTSAT